MVTKKYISSFKNLVPNNFPQGHIDSIQIAKDDNIYVTGWAIEKEFGAPVKEVCIYADDELLGKATLGIVRPDVGNYFGRSNCINSGWEYNGGGLGIKDKLTFRDAGFILINVLIKNHRGDFTYLISFCETIRTV